MADIAPETLLDNAPPLPQHGDGRQPPRAPAANQVWRYPNGNKSGFSLLPLSPEHHREFFPQRGRFKPVPRDVTGVAAALHSKLFDLFSGGEPGSLEGALVKRAAPNAAGRSEGVDTACFEFEAGVTDLGVAPGATTTIGRLIAGGGRRACVSATTLGPPLPAASLLVMYGEQDFSVLREHRAGHVAVTHRCHNKFCLNWWDGHLRLVPIWAARANNGPPTKPSRLLSRAGARAGVGPGSGGQHAGSGGAGGGAFAENTNPAALSSAPPPPCSAAAAPAAKKPRVTGAAGPENAGATPSSAFFAAAAPAASGPAAAAAPPTTTAAVLPAVAALAAALSAPRCMR